VIVGTGCGAGSDDDCSENENQPSGGQGRKWVFVSRSVSDAVVKVLVAELDARREHAPEDSNPHRAGWSRSC
jgi:hypothetical protein